MWPVMWLITWPAMWTGNLTGNLTGDVTCNLPGLIPDFECSICYWAIDQALHRPHKWSLYRSNYRSHYPTYYRKQKKLTNNLVDKFRFQILDSFGGGKLFPSEHHIEYWIGSHAVSCLQMLSGNRVNVIVDWLDASFRRHWFLYTCNMSFLKQYAMLNEV